jgi:dienelactone hydrolase
MATEIVPEPSAFSYDRDAPLDIREAGSERLERATVHDLSFANPAATRVSAYLVQPDSLSICPAVLFLHWGQGDRATFLSEALAYAEVGVESLLIDESRMSHFIVPNSMTPDGARSYLIQCVTDLRRGVDLLQSRSEVDAARIGYVGHSLGASVGGQFAGVEKRVKAHVLMAGFGDTARGWNMARPNDEFLRVVAPLDGIRYVGAAPPSAILFQWASRDEVLTEEDLAIFFTAAKEPKEKRWYDADHSFNHAALCDRAEWLGRQLAFISPGKRRLTRVHLPQRDLEFLYESRPWFAALKRPKKEA